MTALIRYQNILLYKHIVFKLPREFSSLKRKYVIKLSYIYAKHTLKSVKIGQIFLEFEQQRDMKSQVYIVKAVIFVRKEVD